MIHHKIKPFIQPDKIINFILILICLTGFCYQVYLILHQYMLGKTVVNIEVKRLKAQPLPAITVCIPALIRVSESINKDAYQVYMKLLNHGISNRNFTEQVKSFMDSRYYVINSNILRKIVKFDQVFELSIKPDSIKINIIGKTESQINRSFIGIHYPVNNLEFYSITEKPIESVLLYGMGFDRVKCFTFFNALEKYWSSFHFDLVKIYIIIINNFTQFGPVHSYYIAMHHSNILPKYSRSNYFEVKPNVVYSVKYSQLNTELVAKSLESNCVEYDVGNEHSKIRMENDCKVKCIVQKMNEKFKSITRGSRYLYRKEFSLAIGNISLDFTKEQLLDDLTESCSQICKPDCFTKEYFTEIQVLHKSIKNHTTPDDMTVIEFEHNSIPDVIVRHSLEMSLMSFVCNFGGLLGMWLGFSVLSISKHIFDSIRRFCCFNVMKINFINKITCKKNNLFIINRGNAPEQNNSPVVEIELSSLSSMKRYPSKSKSVLKN